MIFNRGFITRYVALVVYFQIILSHVVGNFKFKVIKVLLIFHPSIDDERRLKISRLLNIYEDNFYSGVILLSSYYR